MALNLHRVVCISEMFSYDPAQGLEALRRSDVGTKRHLMPEVVLVSWTAVGLSKVGKAGCKFDEITGNA